MQKSNFKGTVISCYIGYISQAIVNNFYPLLFILFQEEFGITLSQLSLLITANFGTQLLVDILCSRFADRIGYRRCVVTAHFFCAAGLVLLAVLPFALPPFAGLLVATVTSAIGGGTIEVVVSPIIEACPNDNKAGAMSLLHSFYCWGQMAVVLISTLVFKVAGISSWRFLVVFWAVIPFVNAFLYMRVPINTLPKEEKGGTRKLLKQKMFWIFMLMMLCAGAAELAMSQWASAFAESGLKVSKALGDLLGPCMFALFMGISRVFYGKFGEKIRLSSFMAISAALCVLSYLIAAFSPVPLIAFMGCALCGFSVGIMWPGTYSLGAKAMPLGGTAMFALFALGGDSGCTLGPALAGQISSAFGSDIKMGFAFSTAFPLLMFFLALACICAEKSNQK